MMCQQTSNVNSKSFVGKFRFKSSEKFELTVHFKHEMITRFEVNFRLSRTFH